MVRSFSGCWDGEQKSGTVECYQWAVRKMRSATHGKLSRETVTIGANEQRSQQHWDARSSEIFDERTRIHQLSSGTDEVFQEHDASKRLGIAVHESENALQVSQVCKCSEIRTELNPAYAIRVVKIRNLHAVRYTAVPRMVLKLFRELFGCIGCIEHESCLLDHPAGDRPAQCSAVKRDKVLPRVEHKFGRKLKAQPLVIVRGQVVQPHLESILKIRPFGSGSRDELVELPGIPKPQLLMKKVK